MIGAGKEPLIPPLERAHQRAAMGTPVHQHADLSVFAADQDDWLTPDRPAPEIARCRNFALMPDIDPAGMEDAIQLVVEDRLVGVDVGMHPIGQNQRSVTIDPSGAIGAAVRWSARGHAPRRTSFPGSAPVALPSR